VVAVALIAALSVGLDRLVFRPLRRRGSGIVIFSIAALGIALAAVQLLPTLEYLAQSQRATSVDPRLALTYSFWPWRLLGLLMPRLFGSPASGDYWGYGNFWEDAIYLGVIPFGLAVSAALRKGRSARPAGPPEAYRPYAGDHGGVPPLAGFGSGYRFHVTGLAHDERGYPTQDAAAVAALQRRLHAKTEDHRLDLVSYEGLALEDADVAVVAYGISARAARRAVATARARGVRAGLFRPRTLWPFPEEELRDLAGRVDALVVAEMNMGQIVREVERCARNGAAVVPCLRADGQPMTPEEILAHLSPSPHRGRGRG